MQNRKYDSSIRSFFEEVSECACEGKIGVKRLICKQKVNDTERLSCVWEEITCENCCKKYRIFHTIEPSDEFTKMSDAILVPINCQVDINDKNMQKLCKPLNFKRKK